MIQQKLTNTKTKVILITKTLLIFSLFTLQRWICVRGWKWTMIHLLTWACEHTEPCYNCYAQRWTCMVDTLSAITTVCLKKHPRHF